MDIKTRSGEFLLFLMVGMALLIESQVSMLFEYHWLFSICISVPVVILLTKTYNYLNKKDQTSPRR
ncbi:hypothetical protein [Halobacillus amylolyticus]|uniref:Uncharacterized protein n=1 Tax=Halobacillus amylolyticus TaxID=2932259 RepID=A0ABY4HEE9_9BACI|nr:hypothetical protein [Halobacillus amylolyticus]UOR13024.1 hypothetical protein MUO15_05865 [Halobacillus amylolyticus]